MPHYDVYFGPMQYWLRRQAGGWRVEVLIAIETPEYQGVLELPDCALEHELEGPVSCTGKAFSSVETLEVCPEIGHFSAPLTEHNLGALLRQWSERVEEYYNRDARAARLPVTYDFEFVPVRVGEVPATASLVVPLAPSCGRTPYFHAMRSGWSLPIVAHEMGHVLGLLDEYEMFSGIFDFYPKTPFEGAERSRMGLSMREDTRFLPLHHYLILRRYFCPEPGRTEYAAEF